MSYNSRLGYGVAKPASLKFNALLLNNGGGLSVAERSSFAIVGTGKNMGDGNVGYATGPASYLLTALNLDGTNDEIDFGNINHLASAPQGSFSVGAWIKRSTSTEAGYIFGKNSPNNSTGGWGLYVDASGILSITSGNSIANGAQSTVPISNSTTWTYVSATNVAGSVQFYENGVLLSTVSIANLSNSADVSSSATIGNRTGGISAGTYFSGGISNVVFDTDLYSAADWLEISNGPEPLNTVAPAISGDTAVGSVLTSTTGTWNSQNNGTLTYSYQWTADGVDIGGATSSTYTTLIGQVGQAIRCRVRTSNNGGFDSAQDTVSSNAITVAAGGGPVFKHWYAQRRTQMIGTGL